MIDGAATYIFEVCTILKGCNFFCKVRSCAMQGRSVLFFPAFVEKTQRIIPIANVYLKAYIYDVILLYF